MLTDCKGRSSRDFSTERPTPSDLTLWRTTLMDLTSDTYTLQSPLGPFLQLGQPTRQQKFIRQGNTPTLSTAQYLKLVTVFPTHLDNIVSFHSSAFKPLTFQPPTSSVLDVFKFWKNPHRWDTFKCNGNRWWIRDTLSSRFLFMVSGGSYMRHRHAGTCSGAFVLYCSKTRKKSGVAGMNFK